jgi:hypothetical protein
MTDVSSLTVSQRQATIVIPEALAVLWLAGGRWRSRQVFRSSGVTTEAVNRTKKVFSARSDGRIEACVRVYYEDGIYREFVAGVSADRYEAAAMAVALEAKLWATSAAS